MQVLRDLTSLAGRLPPTPTIVLHSGCAEPRTLAQWLAVEAASFPGARVYSMMPMGESPYAVPPASTHFAVTSFFPGKGLRAAVTAGTATTLRHPLSALPGLFDRGEIKADLLLLQVSPPDAHGCVSLGVSVDYMHAVLRQRPLVVAEINPLMPRTCGDSTFDASRIDYCIDATCAPQPVESAAGDAVDIRIATAVAGLVEDGAVLQVGIGSLPDQVLAQLRHHRNLGIHSGILTDAVQPLLESGVVNNCTKRAFRGISVTTVAAGTQPFYDFLSGNAAIEFHPCSLTHGLDTLRHIDRLTAINSALQIDLSGRVNAEAVAGKIVAAPGGLPDFSRGAALAPGGRSILAIRSTFKNRSNIVAALEPGAPVTLEPGHVDRVVTEFGVASLRGLEPVRRAEALIAIAHPEHRAALEKSLSSRRGESSRRGS